MGFQLLLWRLLLLLLGRMKIHFSGMMLVLDGRCVCDMELGKLLLRLVFSGVRLSCAATRCLSTSTQKDEGAKRQYRQLLRHTTALNSKQALHTCCTL